MLQRHAPRIRHAELHQIMASVEPPPPLLRPRHHMFRKTVRMLMRRARMNLDPLPCLDR